MVGDDVPVSCNIILLSSPGLKIDPKTDLKLKISRDKTGDNPHEMFSLGSLWVRLCSPHMKQELPQDTNTHSWWLGCWVAPVCVSCAQLQPGGINIGCFRHKIAFTGGPERAFFWMKCYFIGKSWLGIISGRKSFVYKMFLFQKQFWGKCVETGELG